MNEESPGWAFVLYQEKDGNLYHEHPDGTKTLFKRMEQETRPKIKKEI